MAGRRESRRATRRECRRGQWCVAVSLVLVSGCGSDAGSSGSASPAEVFEFDADRVLATAGQASLAAGSTFGLTNDHIDMSVVDVTDELADLTGASLAAGVEVDADVAFNGAVQLTLPLPEPSDTDAVPGVLHVHDDGSHTVIPGLYDESANTITVFATEFSDFFGGWWNPLNWAEETVQGVQGAYDFVADWVTGRTDPPACADDAPEWVSVTTQEVSSLHVCVQSNAANDGSERFELFLKSNRSTMQMVTIPTDTDFVWVQGQPEWLRPLLRDALADGERPQAVVLFGGQSMSIGFSRPLLDADLDVRAYQTDTQVIANQLLGVLGGVEGEGALAAALTVRACLGELSGFDLPSASGPVEKFEESAEAIVKCSIGLLANPELAGRTVKESLELAGSASDLANQAGTYVQQHAAGLKGTAEAFLKVINVGGAVTRAWDAIFDAVAEGRITATLSGHQPDDVSDVTAAASRADDPFLQALIADPVKLMQDRVDAVSAALCNNQPAALDDFYTATSTDLPLIKAQAGTVCPTVVVNEVSTRSGGRELADYWLTEGEHLQFYVTDSGWNGDRRKWSAHFVREGGVWKLDSNS